MKTYSCTWLMAVSLFLLSFAGCSVERNNKVVSSDGVIISYDVQGEGDPALVFIHGWCCDRRYWNYQVPYFSREYRVVTIDLAGHGLSGFGRDSWTMEAFGGNVVSVVDKLGLEKVILIGHSMGGVVIIEAAKRMPERVVGLVGVDTLHNVETKYPKKQIDDFIFDFKEDFAGTTRGFVRDMFPPGSDPNIVERIVEDMSSAHPLVGVTALLGYFNYDVAEALEEVKVPLYCINTDLLPTNVEANRRHAVSFDVKLMPGMSHFFMIEDPQTFNRLLDEVIDELKIEEKEIESDEENSNVSEVEEVDPESTKESNSEKIYEGKD